MSQQLSSVYLARHGETAWTVTGQHTGASDIPLTERGERNARRLGDRLQGLTFVHTRAKVSPCNRSQRAAARRPVAGADLRPRVDEPSAAGPADLRAGRFRSRRRGRSGPGRVELRRLRRTENGGYSQGAAGLAALPRR